MTEIVVISGKGGTGKTSLTAAFAHLAGGAILCDLDVDAPDLHILLEPEPLRRESFVSGHEAAIDPARCTGCGLCAQMCRFGAAVPRDGVFAVDPLRCEGCKVCVAFCPAGAIDFPERHCGQWWVSRTRFGTMVHARLFPGLENSGRLVTLLKRQARYAAEADGMDLVLSDGAPGIGCPVISSLSGATLAVVVTEPTPSGRHDLERVVRLCRGFKVPAGVIVNKYDLHPGETDRIESDCRDLGCEVLGRIPMDREMVRAMMLRRAVTELPDSRLASSVRKVWDAVLHQAGRTEARPQPAATMGE